MVLEEKDGVDTELLVYTMTLLNKVRPHTRLTPLLFIPLLPFWPFPSFKALRSTLYKPFCVFGLFNFNSESKLEPRRSYQS